MCKVPQVVLDYVEARCNTRVSLDRYLPADAAVYEKRARRLFANADNSTWPALNKAAKIMEQNLHINNVELFCSHWN